MLTKFCTFLLDLIFPKHCLGCHHVGKFICKNCLSEIPSAEKPEHDDDFAIFPYHESLVKQAVWTLKYHGGFNISSELGHILFENYIDWLAENEQIFPTDKQILVVPIPLSRIRRRERGYNQAELLAKHFVGCDPEKFVLVTDLLLKIRDTTSQVNIKNRMERRRNIHKSFSVHDPSRVHNQTIIVIDDVLTTGGTVAEARRILKKSGARHVYGLALAHG